MDHQSYISCEKCFFRLIPKEKWYTKCYRCAHQRFNDSWNSDLKVMDREGKTIYVHKERLQTSPFFSNFFDDTLVDTTDQIIEVESISDAELLLKCFYGHKLQLSDLEDLIGTDGNLWIERFLRFAGLAIMWEMNFYVMREISRYLEKYVTSMLREANDISYIGIISRMFNHNFSDKMITLLVDLLNRDLTVSFDFNVLSYKWFGPLIDVKHLVKMLDVCIGTIPKRMKRMVSDHFEKGGHYIFSDNSYYCKNFQIILGSLNGTKLTQNNIFVLSEHVLTYYKRELAATVVSYSAGLIMDYSGKIPSGSYSDSEGITTIKPIQTFMRDDLLVINDMLLKLPSSNSIDQYTPEQEYQIKF